MSNPNDIYLQKFTAQNTFAEAPLSVQPNCVIVTDNNNNLQLVPPTSVKSYPDITDISGSSVTIFPEVKGLVVIQTYTPNGARSGSMVGIKTEDPQYDLDVVGTINSSQGYQLPDYTTIVNPTEGLMAYNYISHSTTYFNGDDWV